MTRHLVIMAAGTGGHIMPGLAVASEMRARGWSVSWLGTRGGMENRLVPPAGIPLDTIGFRGLRGKGLFGLVKGGVQLVNGLAEAFGILRRRGAHVVLGMGGYVCVPGGVVARLLLRRPLMLVNADAALLLSNRSLLRWADRVAFGFDGPAARTVAQAVVTGNPVRGEIEALPLPAARFAGRSGPLKLLVVGGSLGAQVLNLTVPPALAQLPAEQRPQVVHQTGERDVEAVKAAYAQAGIEAEVLPFIDRMDQRLADCDLIVCRAGAITVSELCAAGVASVLVPLVVSTTGHQRDNAAWLAGRGAAVHLPQTELNSDTLAATLAGLDRPKLLAMAEQARALAQPHAAQRVADQLEQLAAAGLSKEAAA
jgi:UDP-N-acetylglucosamine--N-acetylmuramyl-(pentapeptide) pyrophosphoryl-undecaprenol N-acetylglucosamine transferase